MLTAPLGSWLSLAQASTFLHSRRYRECIGYGLADLVIQTPVGRMSYGQRYWLYQCRRHYFPTHFPNALKEKKIPGSDWLQGWQRGSEAVQWHEGRICAVGTMYQPDRFVKCRRTSCPGSPPIQTIDNNSSHTGWSERYPPWHQAHGCCYALWWDSSMQAHCR